MKSNRLILFFTLLAKSSKFIKVFKVLKVLKFTKPLVTFFSLTASAIIYAIFLGPWFAVGLVAMLFIHEMGHIVALKIKGYNPPGPVFIPMLGAVIFAPKFDNPEDEAFVGYGGPLVGGIAGIILFGIWALLPGPAEIVLLVSYVAVFLNLFNMIPIRPLDGGRVTQVIGPWFKYLGILGLLALTLYIRQPGFLLIWILVLDDINLEPRLKFGLGVACQLAMMLLFFTHPDTSNALVIFIDVILATLFNFGYYIQLEKSRKEKEDADGADGEVEKSEEAKPVINITLKTRLKWFALYMLLLIGLVAVMLIQAPYLPKAITQ